jgi:signal transduction histidine kinase
MTVVPSFRVLVVDDDADTQANLRDILELDDYQIETAGTIAETLARDDWSAYLAIVLDRRLPDGTAEEVLPRLKRLAPGAAVVIVTGYSDLDGAIAAIRAGAADYILKPVNPELIRSRLAGIAERKRAAEEIDRLTKDLQRRVTELETLLDVIPIGIALALDPSCERIRVNAALARLLGLPAGTNASLTAAAAERPAYRAPRNGRELGPEELPLQYAAAKGVEVRDVELEVARPGGEVVSLLGYAAPLFDEAGRPRGAVGAFLDVTERKRVQEQALQTERLAAIGQMMTGLAHESGNALARSQACLEMLEWEVQDRPEAQDLIGRIQKAQNDLKHLYEEVRGYAAPLRLQREPCDLRTVWRRAWENLALRRQGRDASLHEETGDLDLTCAIDLFRLEQVFRNILDNSLAACLDPVRVEIQCLEVRLAGRPAVRVSVRDNGPGLNAEQRQRIFEPFFTTKTKGTGLGMAIAKRIVEAHGGHIEAGPPSQEPLPDKASSPGSAPAHCPVGGGAEVLITLPRETS